MKSIKIILCSIIYANKSIIVVMTIVINSSLISKSKLKCPLIDPMYLNSERLF